MCGECCDCIEIQTQPNTSKACGSAHVGENGSQNSVWFVSKSKNGIIILIHTDAHAHSIDEVRLDIEREKENEHI